MNKKLSKIGLILIAILNFPYVLFLIGGMEPNPVTNEALVAENTRFVIISPIILIVLCVTGLFISEKNTGIYRKFLKLFAVLRVVAGEFGAFWLSFYVVWQKSGDVNPLNIFLDLDKPSLFLVLGVILLLFSLPLMGHIGALMFFEYGLQKEKRMKKLHLYKILLICIALIALIGISDIGAVLYSQMMH